MIIKNFLFFFFSKYTCIIIQTLCVTRIPSYCLHEDFFSPHFLVHVTMSFSFLNQNKCNCKYLQCTRAKVLWQYFYLFDSEKIVCICSRNDSKSLCTSLKEILERTFRNNFQIIRSFEVPRDSPIVGCEYTTQFYAISFLKEDTE